MDMKCLDCLRIIQKRLAQKREARDDLMDDCDADLKGQVQYHQGEIASLEWLQGLMQKALNNRREKCED